MIKIRLIFIILVSLVSVVCLTFFLNFQAPMNPELAKISDFRITQISGNGRIYIDNKSIDANNLSIASQVDMKQMVFNTDVYLRTDSNSAVEIYLGNTAFDISPGGYFQWQYGKGLIFYAGDISWEKKDKNDSPIISVLSPENKLNLSDSGRIKIKENIYDIWCYTGKMEITYAGSKYSLSSRQLFTTALSRRNSNPAITQVLGMPDNLDPLKRDIILSNNPDDSVVRFSWNSAKDTSQYIFRIYTSNLRENLIQEKFLGLNRYSLDLLQFEDERDFYWEVLPFNPLDQREGVASKMGHIKIVGNLIEKKNVSKPPTLSIKNLSVNGNMVYIDGEADPNSQLFINDQPVKIDMDSRFFITFRIPTLGLHKIIIKLISLNNVETIEERYVSIFEE